ncbi:MAG: hypothetical protein RLZZ621_2041 [Gemmatimonadota bacterium]
MPGGIAGSWVEANVFAQGVTNGFGDWSGLYVRGVRPTPKNTFTVDALRLQAFNQTGLLIGAAHRHDWNSTFFHVLGANVGSGVPILPDYRVDGLLGVRLGGRKQWQATGGASYVKSVTELSDIAGTASLAWYAPKALVLEVAGRYNISRPGNIESYRLIQSATYTPSPRRSFSIRQIQGTEGWQIISAERTLQKFSSGDWGLAWREKLGAHWALSLQGDRYTNPFYSRTGVTIGAAYYF